MRLHFLAAAVLLGTTALTVAGGAALAQDGPMIGFPGTPVPAPLKQFEGKGIRLIMVGKSHGLDVWMAMPDNSPASTRFFYVTPDGQAFLDGPMFNGTGENLTREHRRTVANVGRLSEATAPQAAAPQPTAPQPVAQAPAAPQQIQTVPPSEIVADIDKGTSWIPVGNMDAPSEVILFADPTCPHCSKIWEALLPSIRQGTLFVRVVPVGILSQRSAQLAATIMNSEDTAAAWTENERLRGVGQTLPVAEIKDLLPQASLAVINNNTFFRNKKIEGTPYLAWKDKSGTAKFHYGSLSPDAGRREAQLQAILSAGRLGLPVPGAAQ